MAPPTIIMTNTEEPYVVAEPNLSMANVKMLDHMIELNSPIAKTDQMAIEPLDNMVTNNNKTLMPANKESCLFETDLPK